VLEAVLERLKCACHSKELLFLGTVATAAYSLAILKAGSLLQNLALSVPQRAWQHNTITDAFQTTEGCAHGLLSWGRTLASAGRHVLLFTECRDKPTATAQLC
jgi:hypothetical protein